MKELKKVYKFIVEKAKNRRIRAAIILSIYLVFFAFIIPALRNINDTSSNDTEQIQNYTNIKQNYSYSYNIEIREIDDTFKYLIKGDKNGNNLTTNVQLYNNESNTYEEIFDYENINPKFIDLENIISYVNDIKEEFTTNYKDGTIQKNYLVALEKIDSNIKYDETVEMNVYEKDGFITKIIIDGTNFDSKTNKEIQYAKYILEYSKINDIETDKE